MGKILEVFSGRRNGPVYGLNFGWEYRMNGSDIPERVWVDDTPESTTEVDPTQYQQSMTDFIDLIKKRNPEIMDAQFGSLGKVDINGNPIAEDGKSAQESTNTNLQGISSLTGGLASLTGGLASGAGNLTANGLSNAQQGVGGIASRLDAIGKGGIDPAFNQLKDAQLSQLASQQEAQQKGQSDFFSRRGISGSSAALNAQNNLGNQFSQQQQNLVSQLGLQGLQRADMANQQALSAYGQQGQLGLAGGQFDQSVINQQAGLYGQQAGMYGQQAGLAQQQFGNAQAGVNSGNSAQEQRLNALTAGIQNASLPIALQTAQTAAEKSGQTSSGGKK